MHRNEYKEFIQEDSKDINSIDYNKRTKLMTVASKGKIQEVINLIHLGADLNLKDKDGDTALLIAIMNKNFDVAKILISAGADLNIKNFRKKNAIFYAVEQENTSLMEALLESKVNLEIQDSMGNTPLIHAIRYDYNKTISLLIKNKANINHRNRYDQNAIDLALDKKDTTLLKELIEAKPDLDSVNHFDNSPLMIAINDTKTEAALLLIQAGANLNLKNNEDETAFDIAIFRKNLEVISALVAADADLLNPEYNGKDTPLMTLIKIGDTENALKLIRKGANIELQNSSNERALDFAVRYENKVILKAIIDAKGKLDYIDPFKNTALIDAVKNDRTEIALLLIQGGAKLNEENGQKRVLDIVFARNHIALLNELIKAKADINYKDSWDGNTLLMKAIKEGNTEFALALIIGGADLTIKNQTNETVLDLALKHKNFAIVGALLDNGVVIHNLHSLIEKLKMEDKSNLDIEYRDNTFACLNILSNPFKPSPIASIHQEAKKEFSKKPKEKFLMLKQQVLTAIDEGTGKLNPIQLAGLIASYDDSRFRLFKPIQEVKPYIQPTDEERANKKNECSIM